MTKPYYCAHEQVYQSLKSKGLAGWGNFKTIEESGDQNSMRFLESVIEKYLPSAAGLSALDLGCGTGASSFLLCRHGFDTAGVDIAETAIQMAQDFAQKLALKVQFQVQDVLKLKELKRKFDLIYDSHCLHCIVFEEDRGQLFEGVLSLLNPSGHFILDTMAWHKEMKLPDDNDSLLFDDDFVLWHKTSATEFHGIMEKLGQRWCAQRRIYPSDRIKDEVNKAGFKVIEESLSYEEDGHPLAMRQVLTRG